MKRDLDALMTSRNLDAILVSGKVLGNPPLVYLLNGAHVTRAVLIKKRGRDSNAHCGADGSWLCRTGGLPGSVDDTV